MLPPAAAQKHLHARSAKEPLAWGNDQYMWRRYGHHAIQEVIHPSFVISQGVAEIRPVQPLSTSRQEPADI
eukprot:11653740-Karenia_brevis.AAC.1